MRGVFMTELKITQAMLCAAFAIPRSAKLVLISPCGGMAECDVGHEVEPDEYIEATWAAASVPSCEGAKHVESLATLAMNAEKNLAYIHATFPGGDPRDMDWYAAEVAALVWAHKAAQAAAQEKPVAAIEARHAEALREARVQGMREGARIMQECMRLWRGDPDGTMPDWENADTTLATAIEAVRKGER
jgi:hypothetical protein